MPAPRGRQVPFTSALSGLVLLGVMFSLATPIHVAVIFAAWALVYLVECLARDRFDLRRYLRLPEVRAAGLSALVLGGAAVASAASAGRPLVEVLYAACYLAAGWAPLWAGLRALRQKTIDVELLMVIAALCAAGTGNAFDGALLFVIFSSSRALAAIATRRTQESVRSLLTLAPEHATRITADGHEELVPAASLGVADEIVVRPGERIGADGSILTGSSEVDQASVTGEPMPVTKHPGDEVFAGTVNGVGTLRVAVTRRGAESVVARIVAQVEQASTTKAKTQVVLEHIERRYSIGVVVATAAILLLPFALGTSYRPGLLRAMAFMIVASPCALTLATMPALLAAVANAGRHGVLVKGAAVMERLGKVTTVAFDKTGSLTRGTPEVVEVVALPDAGLDADEIVRLAAAVERGSEHPLADAVLKEAAARGIEIPEAGSFRAEPGRGVHAQVDGLRVSVSSPSTAEGGESSAAAGAVRAVESAGATALVVSVDGRRVGVLGLTDQLRPDAARTVAALDELIDDDLVVLTGDGDGAATRTARQAGITDVRPRLLPADKVAVISELQAAGKQVTFVGDGINDAPALMTADVGVAMAHGADLALETSDVVIVRGDLAPLPAMIRLSRQSRRVMIQNFVLAAAVIVGLVAYDLVATLPLPVAVAGHEGSTLLVALNGLRLLRSGAWRELPRPPVRRPAAAQVRRFALATVSFAALGVLAAHQLT